MTHLLTSWSPTLMTRHSLILFSNLSRPTRLRDRLHGPGPAGRLRGLPDPPQAELQAQHPYGDTQVEDRPSDLQPQYTTVQWPGLWSGGGLQDTKLLRHVRHGQPGQDHTEEGGGDEDTAECHQQEPAGPGGGVQVRVPRTAGPGGEW